MFFIIKEAKETVLNFSQGNAKVWSFYCVLIQYQYKMTHYNTLNVKLFNSLITKLKSGIEDEVTLKLSSNVVGDSNDENNFPVRCY